MIEMEGCSLHCSGREPTTCCRGLRFREILAARPVRGRGPSREARPGVRVWSVVVIR